MPQKQTSSSSGKNLNSAQRMTVRVALATAATMAALFGAQILAFGNQAAAQAAQNSNGLNSLDGGNNAGFTQQDNFGNDDSGQGGFFNDDNNDSSQNFRSNVISPSRNQPRPRSHSSR